MINQQFIVMLLKKTSLLEHPREGLSLLAKAVSKQLALSSRFHVLLTSL
jgi:hypothetical protein